MSIFGNLRSAIFPSGAKSAPPATDPDHNPAAAGAPAKGAAKEPGHPGDRDPPASMDDWLRGRAANGGKVPDDLQ